MQGSVDFIGLNHLKSPPKPPQKNPIVVSYSTILWR